MSATLAVIWLGAVAGASAEEMSARATSSHSEITIPGTPSVTYRLEVAAGSEPRRFGVHVRPNYVFGEERKDRSEGPPIHAHAGQYSVEGDLQQELGVSAVGTVLCGGKVPDDHHGGEVNFARMNFFLRAGGRGAFVVQYQVLPTPPWPTTDYRAIFTISPPHDNLGPPGSNLVNPPATGAVPTMDLLPPAPRIIGRRGVRIELQTDPPLSERAIYNTVRELPADTLITIAGSTDPPLRQQTTVLEYQRLDRDDARRHLAQVRTDDAGRFRLRAWRPYEEGKYALHARYTSQSPELADDFTCPWGFRTGAGNPRPELRVDTKSARVKNGGVEVPVRCVGAPPARCRGRLRLTGRRWRRAARYDLAAPSAGWVKLAVPQRHDGSALLEALPSAAARATPARRLRLKG